MTSNAELDELLDGALDDFKDQPSLSATADTAASPARADSPAAGSAATAKPAASSFQFDQLGRASPKPSSQGSGAGKGPSLPPRPQHRSKAAAPCPSQQQQPASSAQQGRPAADAGASSTALPDLAATLQALAMSGPDSSRSGGGGGAPDLEATLRSAAAAVAASASSGTGGGADSDEMLKELAEQLHSLGGDSADPEETDAMVSVIMKQLLSKQVLHQSMKDIGERYPQWLANHAADLSEEELARYTQQHQHILEMCRLYEEDADNFSAIFSQLQKMQACGTPPDEIVQELSPGLQFDAEGMPKLPEGGPPGCSIQ